MPGNYGLQLSRASLTLIFLRYELKKSVHFSWFIVVLLCCHCIKYNLALEIHCYYTFFECWRDNCNVSPFASIFQDPPCRWQEIEVFYSKRNRAPIMGVGNDMGWVCLIGPNGVWRVRLIIMSLQNVIPRPRNWLCLHQMSSRDPKAELWLFQQRPFSDGVTCPFVMVVGSVKKSLPDIWIQEITWFRERWPVAVLEIHFERCWRT